MTPELFRQTWTRDKESLSPLSPGSLTSLNLAQPTIDFLTTAGLPFNAAPFLSFVQDKAAGFNTINKLTNHFDFLEPGYGRYIVIG